MLDIKFIRDNQKAIAQAIQDKQIEADLDHLLDLDIKRRDLIQTLDDVRQKRNHLAQQTLTETTRQQGQKIKDQINRLEDNLTEVETKYQQELYKIPNLPSEDTPIGSSEADNKVIYQFGQKPQFDFQPKPHWEMEDLIDERRAVRISGSRFAFLKGGFVRLQLALIQYGFDVLTNQQILRQIIQDKNLNVSDKPFLPILPPTMMRTQAYLATNRLQTQGDTFKLADDDLWLTGSAEHTLCAYFLDETLAEADLPVRLVGYNTAYRREVGSAGQDTRGIIRQHQFDKLEMESFSHPRTSLSEHHFMIAIQEYLMEQLGVPFQTVLKCTYDMGGPNIRGVDIEAWMPGQDVYRETNSADYLGDFQARGLNTKFINQAGQKQLVHTNDATVFCQRHIVAILENNQTKNGKIRIPEVLRIYLKGEETI
ncbi:MAG: serine--tRNA ligase [Candidatus Saccharibacteria bacterium]|nr:serine--tRNA ligase [Candidatus Saccharibacteria bacterium]